MGQSIIAARPYAKLRGLIREKCGTQRVFARKIGIAPSTVSLKLNGKAPWSMDEVERSCEVLGLSIRKAWIYFFSQ